MLRDPVQKAISELRGTFPGGHVDFEEDGQGGARVRVSDIPLTKPYTHDSTWMGGHITAQTPYADVYPLFVRGDLARGDGKALGEAMSCGHTFMGQPAVQISRKARTAGELRQGPAQKFLKVLDWLRSRP